jgi:hypothetical protein
MHQPRVRKPYREEGPESPSRGGVAEMGTDNRHVAPTKEKAYLQLWTVLNLLHPPTPTTPHYLPSSCPPPPFASFAIQLSIPCFYAWLLSAFLFPALPSAEKTTLIDQCWFKLEETISPKLSAFGERSKPPGTPPLWGGKKNSTVQQTGLVGKGIY